MSRKVECHKEGCTAIVVIDQFVIKNEVFFCKEHEDL